MNPRRLETNTKTRIFLCIGALGYCLLAFGMLYGYAKEISFPGDSSTLTNILVVLGIIITALNLQLSSNLFEHDIQKLAAAAYTSGRQHGLKLREYVELEYTRRVGPLGLLSLDWSLGPYGRKFNKSMLWYALVMGSLTVLSSAVYKKTLDIHTVFKRHPASYEDGARLPPVQGINMPANLAYNMTSSTFNSWTYMYAPDPTPAQTDYYHGTIPKIVLDGRVGVQSVADFEEPMLKLDVACSWSDNQDLFKPSIQIASIQNVDNEIKIFYDGGVQSVNVSIIATNSFSCRVTAYSVSANVLYTSDLLGSWKMAMVEETSTPSWVKIDTTDARFQLIVIIISDALSVYRRRNPNLDWGTRFSDTDLQSFMSNFSASVSAAIGPFADEVYLYNGAGPGLTMAVVDAHQRVLIVHKWPTIVAGILFLVFACVDVWMAITFPRLTVPLNSVQLLNMSANQPLGYVVGASGHGWTADSDQEVFIRGLPVVSKDGLGSTRLVLAPPNTVLEAVRTDAEYV